MKVIWTPEAQQDRTDIWDYIAADSPRAAARMDRLFSDAAARLGEHPMLGRTGKIPGTRELIPHASYRLVYEIDGVICQDSCHVVQAAIFRFLSFCRTGLSQTVAGRSQLRVGPRQRSGRVALAAS